MNHVARVMSGFLIASVVGLSGCGGGGGAGSVPIAASGGQTFTAAEAQAGFVIISPSDTAASATRTPKYISPSTKSIVITPLKGNVATINLTPGSTSCAATSTGTTCKLTIPVPIGKNTFTITTYDGPNGTGNALSTNAVVNFTVPAGGATVPLTLLGIVAKANLTLATTNPPSGLSANIPLSVQLQDAAGNIIVGAAPFQNAPVTLTDTDASGATKPSIITLNKPDDATNVSVAYNGASISNATFSVTASGLSASNVVPAVLNPQTPEALTSSGSGALATIVADKIIYAFVPTSGYGGTGLVEVPFATSLGVISTDKAAFSTKVATLGTKGSTPRSLRSINKTLPGTAGVTACTADQTHLKIYCASAEDTTIRVLSANTVPATVSSTFTADVDSASPLTQVSFSGGGCYLCGIAYDAADNEVIVSTSKGYLAFDPTTQKLKATMPADIAENFGYNGVTNQIFSGNYRGSGAFNPPNLDLINVATTTRYALTPKPVSLDEPDQSAVDNVTNIGITSEEFSSGNSEIVYLLPLNNATLTASSNSFTLPNPSASTITSGIFNTCNTTADGVAVDSPTHIAFFNSEFCTPGTFGAAQMPATTSASPTLGPPIFAVYPNTPDGVAFAYTRDPHALAVTSSGAGHYALAFNGQGTYLAVIDLSKLLKAPRSSSDSSLVDPSYDLIANKVLTYVAI